MLPKNNYDLKYDANFFCSERVCRYDAINLEKKIALLRLPYEFALLVIGEQPPDIGTNLHSIILGYLTDGLTFEGHPLGAL